MKLLITVPALNEEDSIESIIQRSLEARDYIRAHSPVTQIDITVVSDGSTDRTVEIASRYLDLIDLIVFPENRGYGAAIKEAWRRSDADLVGFLDADGTCDPKFFAQLASCAVDQDADIVLGCRLNADSKMPLIRRLGNLIFAVILSALCSSRVRDTASGMRVVRRSSVGRLFPLPNGLHFTPAMSARGMLSKGIKLVEIEMPYRERAGQSKLRVLKDGLRFLGVILQATFLYRPGRLLGIFGAFLLLAAVGLMFTPIVHYLVTRTVAEWMIYRFLVGNLLGITSFLFCSAGYLSDRMVSVALSVEIERHKHNVVTRFVKSRWFWLVPAVLAAAGLLLVLGSVLNRWSTGATYEHWSRYVVMTFCFSVAAILAATRLIEYVLALVDERITYLSGAFQPLGTADAVIPSIGKVLSVTTSDHKAG